MVETLVKFVTESCMSGRVLKPPEWFHNKIFILKEDGHAQYKEVMAVPGSKEGLKAMKSEMESMYENQVWNLVEPPEGVKPL